MKKLREIAASHPWARMAGSAVLLAAALWLLRRHRVETALRNLDPRLIAAVLPVFLLIHLLAAFKWHLLVNRSGAGMRFRRSLECYFAGIFGTLFLPSIAGGDAVTVGLAGRAAARPAGIVTGAVLSRALDTLALAVMVGVTGCWVPSALDRETGRLLGVLLACAGAAGVLGGAGMILLRPKLRPGWLDRLLVRHAGALEPLRRPSLTALPLSISFAVQLSFTLLALAVARRCGVDVGLGPWVFTWSLAKLAAFLPLTIAGIGAREVALAALLAPFGVTAAAAVAVGLVWDVVAVTGALASGALWRTLGWRNGRPD